MNVTVKNIPDTIYKILKREAALRRRSLNAEVILALAGRAEEIERRRQVASTWDEIEKFVAGLPKMGSSVALIREDRERH